MEISNFKITKLSSDVIPADYLLTRNDTCLIAKFPDGEIFAIGFETDELTPVFELIQEIINNVKNEIRPQFLEIKEEIADWLNDKTKIKPQMNGFIDWYIKNRLPNIIYIAPISKVTGKPFEQLNIALHIKPINARSVFDKDLIAYCIYRKQQLESEFELQQERTQIDIGQEKDHKDKSENEEGRNIFNDMPLPQVKKWFMQLAEHNSSNGKPFLTVDQVTQFIKQAFVDQVDLQKLTFNMADGERTSITKLFYLFYQSCTSDYAIEPTKHCKEKYVRLLTDNFTNYKYKTVFGTFNNSRNAKKKWETTFLRLL